MADFSDILSKVKIQYPTDDPMSLQRSITQLKELLENEEFYQALAESSGGVAIRILSGGSGGGGIVLSFLSLIDTPGTFSGYSGKFVRVATNESGLVFENVEWDDIEDKPDVFPPDPELLPKVTMGDTFPTDPGPGDLHYLTVDVVGLYVFYEDDDGTQQWMQANGEGLGDFIDLDDTPVEYTDAAGKTLQVNDTEDGVVFDVLVEADITDLDKYTQAEIDAQQAAQDAAIQAQEEALQAHVDDKDNPHETSWDDLTGEQPQPAPHTHVEADITDLDKYTQAEIDAQQAAQDAALQAHLDDGNNPHNTGWSNLLDKPTDFPPSPHDHVEADIKDLDKYSQAEIDAQQALQDYALELHQGDVANPHKTTWDGLLGKPGTFPPGPHTHLEEDITNLDKYTQEEIDTQQDAQNQNLADHIADKSNPHNTSYNDLGDVPTEFPPAPHTHVEADITDLDKYDQAAIDAQQAAQDAALQAHVGNTNNPHDTDWDNLLDVPEDFPPSAHTHIEAEITDLDKYTQAEIDAQQAAQDAALQAHLDDKSNPHNTNWTNLPGVPTEFPPEDHTHVEDDITDLDRVRWREPYVIDGPYEHRDLVRDGDWTMIANKDTSQRAAPQESGDPQWTLPDLPLWAYNSNASVVESGAEYNVTEPITVVGYQVWVPTISDTTNTVIRAFSYPTDDPDQIVYKEIAEPLLIEDGWTTIALNRTLITAGTTLGLRINSLNSGDVTQVGPFDWARDGNSNNSGPATGEWNRSNNGSTLRINKTDFDGDDRTANLEGIIAGSTVSIVSKDNANESASYTTTSGENDLGAYYEWSVNEDDTGIGGEPPVGQPCVITITVPLQAATDYVINVGGHAGQPNSKGYLAFGGVEQPGNEDNAFGVRLLVDTWTVSEDWDVVSLVGQSGLGGSGDGGGGVIEFISLTDTPISYEGFAGRFPIVNATEDGLDFFDIDVETESLGIKVPNDVGDGTPWGDLNAADFTVPPSYDPDWVQDNVQGTAVYIGPLTSTTLVHISATYPAAAYIWRGPRDVTVGLGGSYTAVESDLVRVAVGDHGVLAGLADDDHPQYLNEERGDARYPSYEYVAARYVSTTTMADQGILSDFHVNGVISTSTVSTEPRTGLELYNNGTDATINNVEDGGDLSFNLAGSRLLRLNGERSIQTFGTIIMSGDGSESMIDMRPTAGFDAFIRFRQGGSTVTGSFGYDVSEERMYLSSTDASGDNSLTYQFRNATQDLADNSVLRKIDADGLYPPIGIADDYVSKTDTETQPVASSLTIAQDSTINDITIGRGGDNDATNTALGREVMGAITGNTTTGAGYRALFDITTGSGNTALGSYALNAMTVGSHNTAIGNDAMRAQTSGSFSIAVGSDALTNMLSGTSNIAIGRLAMSGATSGNYNIAIGASTLGNTGATAGTNVAIGYQALRDVMTGGTNVAISQNALLKNVSGVGNIGIGRSTLENNIDGTYNIAIGTYTLQDLAAGSGNTAIGYLTAGNITSGGQNTVVGRTAFYTATGGSDNTVLGYDAMRNSSGDGVNNNVAVGRNALYNAAGVNNVALGRSAMDDLTSGSTNVGIGYDVQALDPTADNQITITVGGYSWWLGAGDPTDVLKASPGSMYLNKDGGEGTTLFIKESGTDTSGWAGVATTDALDEFVSKTETNDQGIVSDFHIEGTLSVNTASATADTGLVLWGDNTNGFIDNASGGALYLRNDGEDYLRVGFDHIQASKQLRIDAGVDSGATGNPILAYPRAWMRGLKIDADLNSANSAGIQLTKTGANNNGWYIEQRADDLEFRIAAATMMYTMEWDGLLSAGTSVVTRDNGDARYVLGSDADDFVSKTDTDVQAVVSPFDVNSGLLTVRSSSSVDQAIQFSTDNTVRADIRYDVSGSLFGIISYDVNGVNPRVYLFGNDTHALADETVLRKMDADLLYPPIDIVGDYVSKTDTADQGMVSDLHISGRITLDENSTIPGEGGLRLYGSGSGSYIDHLGTGNLNIRQGTDQFAWWNSSGYLYQKRRLILNGTDALLDIQATEGTDARVRFRYNGTVQTGQIYYDASVGLMKIESEDITGANQRTFRFDHEASTMNDSSVLRKIDADGLYPPIAIADDYVSKTDPDDQPVASRLIIDKDIEVNALTVGRGTGDQLTCTAFGYEALFNSETGAAGAVGIGYRALKALTTGDNNIAIGQNAMLETTTASNNVAIGKDAMHRNISGTHNTAIGTDALQANTTGGWNTAVGTRALGQSITANYNVAVGFEALEISTTGSSNVAIGTSSLYKNLTGFQNIAIGRTALANSVDDDNNIGIGYQALLNVNGGQGNLAIGTQALKDVQGNNNIALGRIAGDNQDDGDENIVIGYDAQLLDLIGSDQITIKAGAHQWWLGSGEPTGALKASPGSMYLNKNGGEGTTLFIKESGTDTSGWTAIGSGGSTTTTGPVFPSAPDDGALHYMTAEPMGLFVWYNDGDSSQWVQTNTGGGTDSSAYPIGAIFMSTIPTDPSEQLGYGVWAAMAPGRVLVGVGDNGESTWANGETRGSETQTLTESQMPTHTHSATLPEGEVTTDEGGNHQHRIPGQQLFGGGDQLANTLPETDPSDGYRGNSFVDSAGDHSHTLTLPDTPFDTAETGGSAAHDNVQPSIAVHMWERTG